MSSKEGLCSAHRCRKDVRVSGTDVMRFLDHWSSLRHIVSVIMDWDGSIQAFSSSSQHFSHVSVKQGRTLLYHVLQAASWATDFGSTGIHLLPLSYTHLKKALGFKPYWTSVPPDLFVLVVTFLHPRTMYHELQISDSYTWPSIYPLHSLAAACGLKFVSEPRFHSGW